jgi:hypothetical protein
LFDLYVSDYINIKKETILGWKFKRNRLHICLCVGDEEGSTQAAESIASRDLSTDVGRKVFSGGWT